MIEIEDRQALIAFTFGTLVGKNSEITHDDARIMIDDVLSKIHETPITQEEMSLFETLDNLMYIFRLEETNRKGFRKDMRKMT